MSAADTKAMGEFTRYAIYYLPPPGPLAAFGASWLGWDAAAAANVPQPGIPGLSVATDTPRKYGFHGTLKAPFRLADGCDAASLQAAVADLARNSAPVEVSALVPAALGRFLALVPDGPAPALSALAFRLVTDLDRFRAPLTGADLARRRRTALTARQEAMLRQWGYPYVAEDFRFHMTLTGPLSEPGRARFLAEIRQRLPDLPRPYRIDQIALAAERPDGMFVSLTRFDLTS